MKMKTMFALFILVCSLPGYAGDLTVTKKSPYSVAKTLDRLENIVKQKGITIFARVDHGAGAKKVGKDLGESQLLIFGNPKMGTPLMQEAILMGLDLPMKALAWQDKSGQVWLSYVKPQVLQQRHGIKNRQIIQKMIKALNAITDKAVSR